jgi:PAS domain-containing protein
MLVFSILNRFAENSARYYNQQSKKLAEINRDLKEEVAERKRIESAYRASEEKFRSIFFGIRDLILITTPDGKSGKQIRFSLRLPDIPSRKCEK